jgi:dTDP-glucose 4,6-dehydratase
VHLLVTGGAGFIGSNFVKHSLSGIYSEIKKITVIDNLSFAGVFKNLEIHTQNKNFEFVEADIADKKIVDQIIERVDGVLNFAAETHVDRSIIDSSRFVHSNISGVQVLLDSIKAKNPEARFVQVSTDEVYGSIAQGSWTETSPILPNSPYSASKAGAELMVRSYHRTHALDVVVTRCSNNYGPNQFPEKLIPLFITNLLQGKKVPVYGTGKNVRDWLHVDDHCRGIYSVFMKGKTGEVYNIGGGRELTNNEITSLLLEAMGADQSSIEYVEDRKGHDLRYSVDWTKINRELGYEPQVKFEDGLKQTINWYRDNEAWWKPLKNRMGL